MSLTRARASVRAAVSLAFLLALVAACPVPAHAQELEGHGQEAVVLSGGGARGLAHVGVLQGLEELGYDSDIVVGTSMGAVVGALYAAGYSPEQVRTRIAAVEWSLLFGPTPVLTSPDRDVRHPQITLDLDLARMRVSRGLLGQWRINHALAHLLFEANARSRGDFDRLARRYRAVATDLKTGESVVIARGDLARAARASMAVPGFFAPVTWQERVLVDGGITDNLPTRVARSLGAARIIAVDVSWPPADIESQAPFAVIGRALDLMQEATQNDPIPPDVLIKPDVTLLGNGAQFPNDPSPSFEVGYTATMRDLGRATPVPGRDVRAQPTPPDTFSALVIEAPDSALVRLARSVFRGVAPGRYDEGAVLDAVDRLYDSGLFEAVWASVEDVDGEAARLVLRLEGAPPLSLAAAAAYDNDRGGRAWAALDRYRTVLGRPAILSAAAALGGLDRWGQLSARLHPRTGTSFTLSSGLYVRERDVRFFTDDGLEAFQVLRPGAWLSIEMPLLLRERVASASFRGEYVQSELGPDGISYGPVLRFQSVDADVRVVGIPLLAEAEHRWGEVGYTRAALAASRSVALGPILAGVLIDADALLSDDAPADVRPALGDHNAMPGLHWGELRGGARASVGADLALPILAGYARLQTRLGTVARELDALDDSQLHAGARLGAFWQSPIGEVDAGVGANTRGRVRFDVSLGRVF